jgi:hypothetical protein
MKNFQEDPDSSSLTFSGAAALLLLVAAFCLYPIGEQLWACLLAALAFISLSLAAPAPQRARVRAERGSRNRDREPGRER